MKTCPVCAATCFDDMDVCFGCMHRFGEGGPTPVSEPSAQYRVAPPGPSTATAPAASVQPPPAAPGDQRAPLVVESESARVSVPMVARADARPTLRVASRADDASNSCGKEDGWGQRRPALHAEYRLMLSVVPVGEEIDGVAVSAR